jgi:hypothetical protein
MYDTGGPLGAGVVAVVADDVVSVAVVSDEVVSVVAVVSVVVPTSVEVELSVEVVASVVLAVVSVEVVSEEVESGEDAPVVSVVAAGVESEVEPVRSMLCPSAPDAIKPSVNRTAIPRPAFNERCRNVRRTFSVPCCALRRITAASDPLYDRPSLTRPQTRKDRARCPAVGSSSK